MGGYVGSAEDVRRIRRQEAQREAQKKEFEDKRAASGANVDAAGLRQFGAGQAETLEAAFKAETVGLVTKAEFLSKRTTLADRLQDSAVAKKRAAEEAAATEKTQQAARKAKRAAKAKLSFLEADEDENSAEPSQGAAASSSTAPAQHAGNANDGSAQVQGAATPTLRLGKDPTVETDFLPDTQRSALEQQMRERLKTEWTLRQQIIKNEPLEITFSYWDGTGHRRKVTIRKGDTIADFLRAARDALAPDFRELRGVSASNLMYVKEDIILPNDCSFYDLIVNKARGKSGPLFHFDVHEDVRLQNDARIEKDESHAGKVVERHWYSRNKHIFPASRWEMFDMSKSNEPYTLHGSEVN